MQIKKFKSIIKSKIIKLLVEIPKKLLIILKYFKIISNYFNTENKLIYNTDKANWVIDEICNNIINNLQKIYGLNGKTDLVIQGYNNKVIHFANWHLFFKKEWQNNYQSLLKLISNNQIILTIFHIDEKDEPRVNKLKPFLKYIKYIHTSAQLTKKKLIKLGIPENKIMVIPLGVDLDKFKAVKTEEKIKIKQKLGLPSNKIIIGSFQKDGNGWGEGLEPKLIKGPDIFCEVVIKLAKEYPIYVLLTGPARGYIKNRLKQAGIPFSHQYLKNYYDLVPYWQALDLYLISSRIEGGPKAILEAWASGIPLVSTPVGMVPDIAKNNENILLANNEDTENLAAQAEKILSNKKLAQKIVDNGLKTVKKYGWQKIAEQYYQKLYRTLI